MNLTRADGTFVRTIGPPGEASIALSGPQTHALRASFYALIGFDHILRGVDHLLFLSVLWLVTGTGWSLIRALTGCTVGHSATLSMATAGIATPAVPLVESLIALSIVVVAAESLNSDRTTLSWRYPAAVSSLFGLLHGFGFAGYLRDVGLPKNDEISALLMFNVGVELGQIAFVGTVVLMGSLITRTAKAFPQAAALLIANTSTLGSVRTPAAYASGSIAMFWFVERLWNSLPSVSAIG
jgi:hydrogenase/urease accessory protein HupE